MKANTPEKLYINNIKKRDTEKCYSATIIKYCDDDIEYTRTDAFIEKLECWINENFYQYAGEFAEGILAQFDRTEDAIDSFRKYIKGE